MASMRKYGIPILLVLIVLAARFIPGPRTIDDAYITFRYARNILAGQGFVFNPGERILGTTTPFYTLSMVSLAAFTGGTNAPFPWLALIYNTAADSLSALILWQIGKRLKCELAGFAAGLLWAVAPFSVSFAIGGMETSVYVFLLLASVYAYLHQKRALTTLFAAFAILTRPDALILVGPLALDRLVRALRMGEKLTLREIVAFFVPTLAWAVFAATFFGSPIPHSIQAKLAVYRLDEHAALIRLIQHYANLLHQYNFLGSTGTLLGILIFPALYIAGALNAWRAEKRLLVLLLYPWLYFLTFALPNPLIFRWYLTPPLPAYFLFCLVGLQVVLNKLLKITAGARQPVWKLAVLGLLIVILPFASLVSAWQLHPSHGPDRPAPEMAWFELELLYQKAAQQIKPLLSPGQVLAAGDVGMLGFVTDAYILDTVGLNSGQTLDYYPIPAESYVTNYAIPTRLILEEQPDWIIILEVYGRKTFLADPQFHAAYQLWDSLPTDIYGSKAMLIYHRTQR
ncbi:hypothetical protein ADN00_05455 [Ornatilinea apprima]|uniref:Glycosyltransferase RgtA/B/C/D-like domain-containing protein n=1 Tax=Ornatilinea apprima TaxID=1134406 RepID=A0A0P6XET6_9CHLR|nr:hypothetical protein [Ornatilinea apprima]KPL78696.1 hypothetical protein ADN00_05455 [Ornatilinea apprima]